MGCHRHPMLFSGIQDFRLATPHTAIRTTTAFKICMVLVGTVTFILSPLILHFLGSGSSTTGTCIIISGRITTAWYKSYNSKFYECIKLKYLKAVTIEFNPSYTYLSLSYSLLSKLLNVSIDLVCYTCINNSYL